MDVMMALGQLLKNLLYKLPMLIVLVSTLIVLLGRAKPGKLRNTAIVGLAIMLFASLLSSSFSLLPILWGDDYFRIQMLMTGLGLAFSLLQTLGFGLLAWALVKAMPQNQSNIE